MVGPRGSGTRNRAAIRRPASARDDAFSRADVHEHVRRNADEDVLAHVEQKANGHDEFLAVQVSPIVPFACAFVTARLRRIGNCRLHD